MKKKLAASEREPFELTETAGGVKLTMNAGMYELFRHTTAEYFGQSEMPCKRTDVKDKTENIVETRFRISAHKSSGHFTLNLYHTTTSCLVNGRNTTQFLNVDLPNIFSMIETKVSQENCTINDFNANIRDMIVNYLVSCENRGTDDNDNSAPVKIIHSCSENKDGNQTDPDEQAGRQVSDTTDPCTIEQTHQATQTTDDVFSVVSKIHSEILDLKQSLTDHITFTNNKFSQICDEMVQIKKQAHVHHSYTDQALQEIQNNQSDVKIDVQKVHDNIQRRIQGIFDSLRNLHEKSSSTSLQESQPHVQNSTPPIQVLEDEQIPTTQPQTSTSDSNQVNGPASYADVAITKSKILIIGDSVVKGIEPRGLDAKVDRATCPGAIIPDIGNQVSQMDMNQYSNVIVYVGGNDVSAGKATGASGAELLRLTRYIQNKDCRVFLCTMAPRRDADVSQYNDVVREICVKTGADLINTYQSFVYGDGSSVRHYFTRDGIHLNRNGSQTLVRVLNKHIQIVKNREPNHTNRRAQTSTPRGHTSNYSGNFGGAVEARARNFNPGYSRYTQSQMLSSNARLNYA